MTASFSWKPFADLPADAHVLTSGELEALQLVWAEQKGILEQGGALEKFHEALGREWSIETGVIEGVYSLDRGTTQLLIERGIDASLIPHEANCGNPAFVAAVVHDHQEVLEGLFAFVKGERELTAGYVKDLHAALLRHQESVTVVDQLGRIFEKPLERGVYKKSPNNPTRPDGLLHEYCPPEQVSSEVDRMITLHQEHTGMGIPPEVEAAWLHHVFTQIHPFEDGNGRVARALSTLVFLKARWFPLVVVRDDRSAYISALESADLGDLKPLVSLFSLIQRRSVVKAIEVASEVHPPVTIDEAVAAVRAQLVTKGQIMPKEWNQIKTTAASLRNLATNVLRNLANKLHLEIAALNLGYQFQVSGSEQVFPEIQVAAAELGYKANFDEFHQWVEVSLKTEVTSRLLVSFHGIGSQFRGLLAVSVFLVTGSRTVVPVSDDFFQFNYKDKREDVEKRFRPWLDAAIVKGLTLWRQNL